MNSAVVLSLVGILLGIVTLIILMYKGLSPLLVCPLAAIVVAVFSGLPVVNSMLKDFANGTAAMFGQMIFIIVCSCIFGTLFTACGFTKLIGEWIANTMGPNPALPPSSSAR